MSLLETMTIGQKSVTVHGQRIKVHAKNIANLDTPNYIRKIPVLNATDDMSFHGLLNTMKEDVFGTGALPFVQGGVEDPNLGERLYRPGHPDADANGYIRASNVNPMVDIADANIAQRAYEANLAVITIAKSMALKAVEIGR